MDADQRAKERFDEQAANVWHAWDGFKRYRAARFRHQRRQALVRAEPRSLVSRRMVEKEQQWIKTLAIARAPEPLKACTTLENHRGEVFGGQPLCDCGECSLSTSRSVKARKAAVEREEQAPTCFQEFEASCDMTTVGGGCRLTCPQHGVVFEYGGGDLSGMNAAKAHWYDYHDGSAVEQASVKRNHPNL